MRYQVIIEVNINTAVFWYVIALMVEAINTSVTSVNLYYAMQRTSQKSRQYLKQVF